jgi:hypothetical protein
MYTVTSRSTIIGRAMPVSWSTEPGQLFLQFLPASAFEAIRPRLEATMESAEVDSGEEPYDAYPELVDLDLAVRDETGLIVASGVIAIIEGTGAIADAPPEVLRQFGLEPTEPLLFLSAPLGGSLEDCEPERHKGKRPQPHASRAAASEDHG